MDATHFPSSLPLGIHERDCLPFLGSPEGFADVLSESGTPTELLARHPSLVIERRSWRSQALGRRQQGTLGPTLRIDAGRRLQHVSRGLFKARELRIANRGLP